MAPQPTEQQQSAAKQRRSNKPLMEKRRRERINKSLDSLKEMVLVAEQKDVSKFSKLEKADILEMTVRHIKSLHDTCDLTSKSLECTSKYKAGFDRCTTEVQNWLKEHVSQDILTRIFAHLTSISNSLTKDSKNDSSSSRVETKIKAPVDRSVFNSDVIRHDGDVTQDFNRRHSKCFSEPQHQHMKLELNIPPWGGPFPPSPPDSSRCSSSPDSLRGSPRYIIENVGHYQAQVPEKQITSLVVPVQPVAFVPLSSSQESTPLNLSTSHHHREESLSPPFEQVTSHSGVLMTVKSEPQVSSTVKIESSTSDFTWHCDNNNIPSTPSTSTASSSASGSRHRLTPELISQQKRCLSGRPTPYPKKDAVRRYHTENPALLNAGVRRNSVSGDRPNSCSPYYNNPSSNDCHWRPW